MFRKNGVIVLVLLFSCTVAFLLGGILGQGETPLQFVPFEVAETNFGIVQGQDTLVFLKKWVSLEDSTKAKEAGWLLGGDRAGEDGGSKEGEMITSDEQAFQQLHFDRGWFKDVGYPIGDARQYPKNSTSDDYQQWAGELGYVIEPTHLRKSKWNCEISTDGDVSYWQWQSGDDYDAFPTMLSAMQHGFWKVVELATEKP